MIYQLNNLGRKLIAHPWAAALKVAHKVVSQDGYPLKGTALGRLQQATLESGYRLLKPYPKPTYQLDPVEREGVPLAVLKEKLVQRPFGDLVRFHRRYSDEDPKVLFVAALSGHYATLSQQTFREFLPDHDVYVTDWHSARDVPVEEGDFGLDEYIDYLLEFIEYLGPNVHLVGLCQASVPVLAAAAILAGRSDPNRPASLTLMAGPVDTRVNPQPAIERVSRLVDKHWFRYALRTVPAEYAGAGRKVYPGWAQLGFFMSLNLPEHIRKHWQFFFDVCQGNEQAAQKHRDFYDEYFATLDGDGAFYLQTLERVFYEFHLADGKMTHHGEPVSCDAIEDIALFTIEGERDDLCLVGNTRAAHDLCTRLPDHLHAHHLQPGVGHYGVFNGSRFRQEIAPRMKAFIAQHRMPERG